MDCFSTLGSKPPTSTQVDEQELASVSRFFHFRLGRSPEGRQFMVGEVVLRDALDLCLIWLG
jgi:hypothetical protein